ncbi:hypothetical protein D3C80_1033960 [compost metagenome]
MCDRNAGFGSSHDPRPSIFAAMNNGSRRLIFASSPNNASAIDDKDAGRTTGSWMPVVGLRTLALPATRHAEASASLGENWSEMAASAAAAASLSSPASAAAFSSMMLESTGRGTLKTLGLPG